MLRAKNTNSLKSLICAFTIIYGAFAIVACKLDNRHHEKQFLAKAIGPNKTKESEIVGDWEKAFPFSVTNLSIYPNGRFKYVHQGCLGTLHSEGNWFFQSNEITLRSDSIYNIAENVLAVSLSQTENDKNQSKQDLELAIIRQSNKIKALRSDSIAVHFSGKKLVFLDGKLLETPIETKDSMWAYRKRGEKYIGLQNIKFR